MTTRTRVWITAAALTLAYGLAPASADATGGPSPGGGEVATDDPPVPATIVTNTTVEIVATDDPPVPPSVATDDPPVPPTVATGVPPTRPPFTLVSPARSNPAAVLPETGPVATRLLGALAALFVGIGALLSWIGRRLVPVPVRQRRS